MGFCSWRQEQHQHSEYTQRQEQQTVRHTHFTLPYTHIHTLAFTGHYWQTALLYADLLSPSLMALPGDFFLHAHLFFSLSLLSPLNFPSLSLSLSLPPPLPSRFLFAVHMNLFASLSPFLLLHIKSTVMINPLPPFSSSFFGSNSKCYPSFPRLSHLLFPLLSVMRIQAGDGDRWRPKPPIYTPRETLTFSTFYLKRWALPPSQASSFTHFSSGITGNISLNNIKFFLMVKLKEFTSGWP